MGQAKIKNTLFVAIALMLCAQISWAEPPEREDFDSHGEYAIAYAAWAESVQPKMDCDYWAADIKVGSTRSHVICVHGIPNRTVTSTNSMDNEQEVMYYDGLTITLWDGEVAIISGS
jgi:hypothetical protein